MPHNNEEILAELIANETGQGSSQRGLSPQQLLVVAGIMAGLLDVDSILVDKYGNFDIVLSGTIKGKKQTQIKKQNVTLLTPEE